MIREGKQRAEIESARGILEPPTLRYVDVRGRRERQALRRGQKRKENQFRWCTRHLRGGSLPFDSRGGKFADRASPFTTESEKHFLSHPRHPGGKAAAAATRLLDLSEINNLVKSQDQAGAR